ncbi:MAG: hypothetical protein Q8S73_30705 [Deltaproteobacteria bacterium]|nr:hypothetical protein [Myxococcales bacterium]MDP3218513.1 hypothetical protein [Deltaproteobacteria bacterium]
MRPRCEQYTITSAATARRCRRRARWRLTTPSRAWAVCPGCREGALAVLRARGVVGVEGIG